MSTWFKIAGAHGRKLARMAADFAIKAKDDAARTFEGVQSTSHLDLGDWTGIRDIVYPGAFKRTLDHFKSAANPYLPLLDSHNYHSVLNVFGQLIDAEEKLTGQVLTYERKDGGTLEVPEMELWTKWQVIPGVDGERVLDRLRPGSVRKMSFGYEPTREEFVELTTGKTRLLRELAWEEGSLVVFGMNPNAETDPATVKSLLEAMKAGELTPDQIAEIKGLPDAQKAELRALLEATPPAPPEGAPAGTSLTDPAPEKTGMDANAQAALALKLRLLTLRGPAAQRHSLRTEVTT